MRVENRKLVNSIVAFSWSGLGIAIISIVKPDLLTFGPFGDERLPFIGYIINVLSVVLITSVLATFGVALVDRFFNHLMTSAAIKTLALTIIGELVGGIIQVSPIRELYTILFVNPIFVAGSITLIGLGLVISIVGPRILNRLGVILTISSTIVLILVGFGVSILFGGFESNLVMFMYLGWIGISIWAGIALLFDSSLKKMQDKAKSSGEQV